MAVPIRRVVGGGLDQQQSLKSGYTSSTTYETVSGHLYLINADRLSAKGMKKVQARLLAYSNIAATSYVRLAAYTGPPWQVTPIDGTEKSFIPTTDSTVPTVVDTGVGMIPAGAKVIAVQAKTSGNTLYFQGSVICFFG
jgi:hypothetical protein